jgi:hypothetical protein
MTERREHLLAVVTGHGLRILPLDPCVVTRGPGNRSLDIYREKRFVRILADGAGGYTTQFDQHTKRLHDIARVDEGLAQDDWQIETGRFRAVFPSGFALRSVEVHAPTPFELVGPEDSLIFVQSPLEPPSPDQLVGPGQEVTMRGETWIELSYEHERAPWWRRHEIAHGMVFTAQAPEPVKPQASRALQRILKTLTLI